MSSYAVKARKARKFRRCPSCRGGIEPGEVYLMHVEFPGGDAGYADAAGHPVTMPECANCASKCDRFHLIAAHDPEGQALVQAILDRVAIQKTYPAPAAQDLRA